MKFERFAHRCIVIGLFVTLSGHVAAQDTWRLNVGGPEIAASPSEEGWQPDAHYLGGAVSRSFSPAVSGIERWERRGDFAYQIPLKPGRYHLTLLFGSLAPWDGLMPSDTLAFEVRVQGKSIRAWVDARLHTSGQNGWPLVIPVEIGRERELTIEFETGRKRARLAGLRVTPSRERPVTRASQMPEPTAQVAVPHRVNAGGPEVVGLKGVLWLADTGSEGGDVYTAPDPIAGTRDDALYRSERYGDFAYRIPVDDGTYEVRLHFAEVYYGVPSGDATGGPGSRVFDVRVEGTLVLDDLDLVALVRPATAFAQSFLAEVKDGVLDIELTSIVDSAKLSALEVLPIQPKGMRSELSVLRPLEDFPPTEVDSSSALMEFEVRNTGLVAEKLHMKVVGPHVDEFPFEPGATQTLWLQPGESWIAPVRFTPRDEGQRRAKLVFTGGPVASEAVDLRGEGRAAFDRLLRINAGGAEYRDQAGNDWEADTGFSGGEANSYSGEIQGTDEDGLYQVERFGNFSYAFTAPNGRYLVRLHFAEVYWGAPGGGPGGANQRLFNVWAEDQLEVSSLDLWSTYGPVTAAVIEFELTVGDEQIDLRFESLTDFATVSALEVERVFSIR